MVCALMRDEMSFKDLCPVDLKIYLDLELLLVLFISHQLSKNKIVMGNGKKIQYIAFKQTCKHMNI